jgi:CRP-like cAMP-binding protein
MSQELSKAIAESKALFRHKWAKLIEERGYGIEVAQFDTQVRNRHSALWTQFLKGLETDQFEPYLALLEQEARLQARASSRVEALISQLTIIMNLMWEVISTAPSIEANPALLLPLTRTINQVRCQAESIMLQGYLEESRYIEQEQAAESAQMRRLRLERTNLPELIKSMRAFRLVRYSAGQLIFQPGDNRDVIYFIMRGRAKIYEILPDARAITLSILGKNDVFAQSSTSTHYFHDVYAEAMQDSLLACIQENALSSLMEESPVLTSRIINSFSQQLSQSQVLIEGLIGRDVGIRLITILLKLSEEFGVVQPGGMVSISMSLTHQELADMIGSNRVTVTRKLAQLQQKNLIKIERGIVSINKRLMEEMVA